MKVLMITGDKRFGPGHERYEVQKAAVERLDVLYWGRGSMWPRVPAGKFDVVTAQDPFWRGLFALRVARRLRARLNVQVHVDLSTQGTLRLFVARFVLKRADSVRVMSEKIKRQVELMLARLPAGRQAPITVLPVYVDIERFARLPRTPHPQKTILWIGRFEVEKDPLHALDVIKKVPEAKLIMLGSGSLEKELKEAARGLPVEFPGWGDPAEFLPQADVVLSTSLTESWGQSMVEALAAGVPVVAPDVGIAREAGAVVVPRERLADAVTDVLKTPATGELRLRLLSREDWVRAWQHSL
jgi:glycosyltransferase involved in cell wall biosynthesis